MKLMQTLLEEQLTNKHLMKVFGTILINLDEKLNKINATLEDIKKSNAEMERIEKNNINNNVVYPGYNNIPFTDDIHVFKDEIKTKEEQLPSTIFIPSIEDNSLVIQKEKLKSKTISKNFTSAATKLKEDKPDE